MSRQTYTYKINKDKIRDNLLPRLKDEKDNVKSFSNYIFNKINPDRYPPFDPLEIIETLQGSHIDYYSVTAWGLVFDWIWDNHYSEDGFDSLLDHLGFESIYELYTKDKCWVYVNQIHEFENMNDLDHVYHGTYFLYTSDFFKHYLNYLLILLGKISVDAQYKGRRAYFSETELPLNDNDIDDILDEQTNQALIWIREDNEREDMIEGKESNYGRSRDRMHYYVAPEMFFHIKELQETLRHYDGNIFIYDSQ
ncbi:hypothetical protein [Chitinophaga ginsengisoli]|uniref:Uncharacterized protein n=1 Tax=Chitinophaga ginsengisoli TaxID=363837 RepID=A0A2P8GDN5_9BACT|nr:hypothetical protein [Chitinophaga ginsengisoli]PSL32005.1 hypothetical protein CLV42_104308 [Chitinophaga ginsengisoli]